MMPAVHGDRMSSYGTQMKAITDQIIARIRPGSVIDMQEITLRVILETVFGLPPGKEQDHLRAVLVKFMTRAQRPAVTIVGILASGDRFRNFLAQRWGKVIDA
jgi:cytochrome P450